MTDFHSRVWDYQIIEYLCHQQFLWKHIAATHFTVNYSSEEEMKGPYLSSTPSQSAKGTLRSRVARKRGGRGMKYRRDG